METPAYKHSHKPGEEHPLIILDADSTGHAIIKSRMLQFMRLQNVHGNDVRQPQIQQLDYNRRVTPFKEFL